MSTVPRKIDPLDDPIFVEALRIAREQKHAERARYDWHRIARPSQLAPQGNWRDWLILAGRGSGKTRAGAEWVREQIEAGACKRMALVGPTAADCRDVMVEGESGLLNICPPWNKPDYEPSKRRLTWPGGQLAFLYSAEEPERLRGPQHDGAWTDEVAAWKYLQETWSNLKFGLRIGKDPKTVVSTTPKPLQFLRELRAAKTTVLTIGSTYDNRANLAPAFFDQIIKVYEGSRLARQELLAELLDDVPDALWRRAVIDELRILDKTKLPAMRRIVVAVDPAVTAEDESDETGIVVVGVGDDDHGYVLADRSLRASPEGWARAAIGAFREFEADGIVAEVNNGGDMVESTLRTVDPSIPYRAVRASRGKVRRAEPVSALYEQRRFHHVGSFSRLEDQMCQMTTAEYLGTGSPDHMDALVWGATEVMIGSAGATMQVLPEFRPERRKDEEAAALHVVSGITLKPWWFRWISLEYADGVGYAHWWCQDAQSRAHVYKELVLPSASAERAGMQIAAQSLSELNHAKALTLWLSEDFFETGLGRKTIAAEIQGGIESVLGLDASFLDAPTGDERYLATERMIREAITARRSVKNARIVVRAAKGEDSGGWEYIRGLMRWKPINQPTPMAYNRDFALHLSKQEDGPAKVTEYLKSVEGRSDEVLPKLLIHDCCPVLIRAIPGLSRGSDGKPQKIPASTVAWSLLYGAIGHQAELQNREPKECFIQRRLDAVVARRPDASTQDLWMAQQKAEWDHRKIAVPLSFGAKRRRRPSLV